MNKTINDITYLLIALFVCVFPVLHYTKMLQVTTLPKFVLMIMTALAMSLLVVTQQIFKMRRTRIIEDAGGEAVEQDFASDKVTNKEVDRISILLALIFGLWALMFSWSDIAQGNLTALFGVDSSGIGIILIFCAAIFFRSSRLLNLNSISRKNFLWFYTAGINLSLLVWVLVNYFKDLAESIDASYLELGSTSTYIDQSTFLVFMASLAPIIFSLIFIEKNKLLKYFAAMLFAIDMFALSRIFDRSADEAFFYGLAILGVGVACAGLLDPRRRPLKNAYLKLCAVFISLAVIIPVAGGTFGFISGNNAEDKVNSSTKYGIMANAMGAAPANAPVLSSHNALMALTHSPTNAVLLGNGIGAFEQVFFAAVRQGTIQGNFNYFPVTAPTFALEVLTVFGLLGFFIMISAAFYFFKAIVSHNTATPFFYAVSASAMILILSIFYVPMNFQSIIVGVLLIGISMGQRTNAISKDNLEKNVDRALTQNHPYLQKKVSIAAFSLTAIFLAYSAITAVQDLKTELSYFKADKHDDLEDIRKISTLSTQYGAVETAAAKYIIFDGFANKDAKIQREGFMILEKLRQKNPQNLNVLNEITLNAFLVNDYDKALAALTSMNQLNTSSTNIINGIGYAHYKKGDMGNALDHFQRALIINDSSPVTYFLIRDVFLKLGDKRMADKFDKKGALLKRKYGR